MQEERTYEAENDGVLVNLIVSLTEPKITCGTFSEILPRTDFSVVLCLDYGNLMFLLMI